MGAERDAGTAERDILLDGWMAGGQGDLGRFGCTGAVPVTRCCTTASGQRNMGFGFGRRGDDDGEEGKDEDDDDYDDVHLPFVTVRAEGGCGFTLDRTHDGAPGDSISRSSELFAFASSTIGPRLDLRIVCLSVCGNWKAF